MSKVFCFKYANHKKRILTKKFKNAMLTINGGAHMAYAKKEDAIAYVNQYQKEKYDRITVMAAKGKKAEYEAAAKFKGMKLSAFVQDCVEKELERMKK